MELKESVDKVLKNRQQSVAAIEKRLELLSKLQSGILTLRDIAKESSENIQLQPAAERLDSLSSSLVKIIESAKSVKKRFSRDTINIGVAGGARVGKSTTLQSLTGLTDEQIPSGSGNPVTAVASTISNIFDERESPRAEIDFYTEDEFFENRILSRTSQINALKKIKTLNDFVRMPLEELEAVSTDGEENSTEKNVELDRLREIKRYWLSFRDLLGQQRQTVWDFSEIKKYVKYPDPETDTESFYPAVKAVNIFCQFPNLAGIKLKLMDLPGLGEAGKVDDIQIKGLNSNIDHIIRIAMPENKDSYISSEYIRISNKLDNVQREVTHREKLITHLINVKEGSSPEIIANFEKNIIKKDNTVVKDKNLYRLSVIDSAAVTKMFSQVLETMITSMGDIDREFIDACLSDAFIEPLKSVLNEMTSKTKTVIRSLPTDEQQIRNDAHKMFDNFNTVLDEIEKEWKNTSFNDFAQVIYQKKEEIDRKIDENLCFEKSSRYESWDDFALKEARSVNAPSEIFNRECLRLKIAILEEYEQFNIYYRQRINDVKNRIVDAVRGCLGNLISAENTGSAALEELITKLEKNGRNIDRLIDTFTWLRNLRVEFFQQIYPTIVVDEGGENVLTDLDSNKNPYEIDKNDNSMENNIARMKQHLHFSARSVNQAIQRKMMDNRFLENYICATISYFHDKLTRFNRDEAEDLFEDFFRQFYHEIYLQDTTGSSEGEYAKKILREAKEVENLITYLEEK